MAKIVCEKCGTEYKFEVAKDFDCCPVCKAPLIGDDGVSSYYNEPSFGDDVELSENDSFDENKIEYYWYEIREPGTLGQDDTGDIGTNCTKCGHFSFAPYPIAQSGDYLLIDSRFRGRCSCGNEMKNHIISKRPSDWVDPRKREMWATDYTHMPKCPICSSTKIHKISMTNKAASAFAFGIFAAGHVSKTYKCDICGAKF